VAIAREEVRHRRQRWRLGPAAIRLRCMNVGERWAYRARIHDDPAEVEIEFIGTKRPARVKVRFPADEDEGRVDWVPPSRLKSLWDEREAFLSEERGWAQLVALTDGDAVLEDAVETVLRLLVPRSVATVSLSRSRRGVLTVQNTDRLVELTDLDRAELEEARPKMRDEDGLHLPWPVAVRVARMAAAKSPTRVMEEVHREEENGRYEAAYGGLGEGTYAHTAARMRSHYEEFWRPLFETLRSWCGDASASSSDEVRDLRVEIDRIRAILDLAVGALRDAGDERTAWMFQRLLHPLSKQREWREELSATWGARQLRLDDIRRTTWRARRTEPLAVARRSYRPSD
jgi:hypothetical protein